MRTLLAYFLLLSLTSCFVGRFAENEPLLGPEIAKLQPGTTTAKEVVELLGAPTDVVQLGKRSAYLYLHRVEKNSGLFLLVVGLFSEDARSDRAWLFFDEGDVLSHVATTLASHRPQYAMPWNDLYDPEDAVADDADREAVEQGIVAGRKQ